MKKGFFAIAIASLAAGASAQFTPGRLVVSVFGDGITALSSASAQAQLQEFLLTGTPSGFSVTMPTTSSGGNNALTVAGTASSEGQLTLSTNSQYLTFQGYNAPVGTAAVAGTTATAIARTVGRIDMLGNVDTTTSMGGAYSAGNIRGSVSTNGTDIWTSGTGTSPTGGSYYTQIGSSSPTQIQTAVNNSRDSNIFFGQLYISSGSGAFVGVNSVGSGTPTSGTNTVTNVINTAGTGTGTASPYDFFFSDVATCYISDDRALASGGGIQKWTFNGTAWTLAYTLNASLTAGTRGLTGIAVPGTGVILYATTADSITKLVSVVDTGSGSLFTTLASAGTNQAFRGVEFTPSVVPEPATMASVALGVAFLARRRRRV